MTALFLALALAQAQGSMTSGDPDPAAAMNVAVAKDPRPSLQLTLVWPGGQSAGLWLSEEQAIKNAQELAASRAEVARLHVPYWVWVGAGVIVGGVVGYGAHAVLTK